jgi:hypothetical protein
MRKKIVLLSIILSFLPAVARATVAEGWERHVIGDQTSPIYLYVVDMDGDGDLDIVSTTDVHPIKIESEVAWFQNNLKSGGAWKKIIISSRDAENPIFNANGVVTADIDKDGRLDVVVGCGQATVQEGTVYWFKAPEDPTQANWQRFQVEPATNMSFFKMYTMDVNNDKRQDIIAGTNAGTYVYINPENPAQEGAQWERLLLEGTGSSDYLADMDRDGKMEIVNSHLGTKPDYKGNVSWQDVVYKNGEVSFPRTMIDDNLFKAFDVNVMDVNGDFKNDVLVSIFQTPNIYWYEAPVKSGDPWTKHTISDTFEGTDMYTGDINRDGKDEMIISGLFTNKISWFSAAKENGEITWTEHVLDDEISTPGDISLDDLDGDGDLDVVLAGMGEYQMIWYENKMPQEKPCVFTYVLGRKSPVLEPLRKVRDTVKLSMPGGENLVDAYYAYSPVLIKTIKACKSIFKTF